MHSDDQPPVTSGTTGGPEAYREPFGWWGYHLTPPEPRSLVWLIERGMLDIQSAAFLALAVEARASLIVAAEPHEAGKTTLLTALLEFLSPESHPIYLRGWYERFAFLDTIPPAAGYLLCNEISSHLPTYLWGRGVRRVFEAAAAGYPLATTMHATSAADAFSQLVAYPLNVPEEHLNAIDLVVTIGVGYASNQLLRRVARVERIRPGADGPRLETLAVREPLRAGLSYQVGRFIGALAELAGVSDSDAAKSFARMVRLLEGWAGEAGTDMTLRQHIQRARRSPS